MAVLFSWVRRNSLLLRYVVAGFVVGFVGGFVYLSVF